MKKSMMTIVTILMVVMIMVTSCAEGPSEQETLGNPTETVVEKVIIKTVNVEVGDSVLFDSGICGKIYGVIIETRENSEYPYLIKYTKGTWVTPEGLKLISKAKEKKKVVIVEEVEKSKEYNYEYDYNYE